MHAKQVIFNVGAGLASYLEVGDIKIANDLGSGNGFNPVTNFLKPLFEARSGSNAVTNDKWHIDQLIISHPHYDHLSAICDFDRYFDVGLLTCQNEKWSKPDQVGHLGYSNKEVKEENLDWRATGIEDNECTKKLRSMYEDRSLPLRRTKENELFKQRIFWIPPKQVRDKPEFSLEKYANNISLVTYYLINGYSILMPGDMQRNGITEILRTDYHNRKTHAEASPDGLVSLLQEYGVDILIAPHHGHYSSFNKKLFKNMKNKKTRCINIIPEKIDENGESDVCEHYHEPDYCAGENNLSPGNGKDIRYAIKTSNGHICIDYSPKDRPNISIVNDNDELLRWFIRD